MKNEVVLTDAFMAIYNGVESQKQRVVETFNILEARQKDMIMVLIAQLGLDEGTWKIVDKKLVKEDSDGNG